MPETRGRSCLRSRQIKSVRLETRYGLCYCSFMNRLALKRLLERLGFVHVAGWVRVEDAPAIRRKIEAAKADVEKAKRGEE